MGLDFAFSSTVMVKPKSHNEIVNQTAIQATAHFPLAIKVLISLRTHSPLKLRLPKGIYMRFLDSQENALFNSTIDLD